MSCYDQLAACYDALTGDVAYEQRADYLENPPLFPYFTTVA